MTILEIDNLQTYYRTEAGMVRAVDGVTLKLVKNERLGIIGESGSGKSTLVRSINRILPRNAVISGGGIQYDGEDLTELSEKELQGLRWEDISMIPQSAMNSLDPVYTVGDQFVEIIRHHRDLSKKKAWELAVEMFKVVDLEEARLKDYPHQFSGGMKQRAMIALALVLEPSILIADEPTTALDVIVQKQILDRINTLIDDVELSLILVTHDISVVSETCDRIAVMYGGRVVEYGDKRDIIKNPYHPYTIGLKNSFPDINEANQELISIPGEPPSLDQPLDSCRFVDRCPFATEECEESHPDPVEVDDGHLVECHRHDEVDLIRAEGVEEETWTSDTNE